MRYRACAQSCPGAAAERTSSCPKSGEGRVQSLEDLVELFCAILHPLLALAVAEGHEHGERSTPAADLILVD